MLGPAELLQSAFLATSCTVETSVMTLGLH